MLAMENVSEAGIGSALASGSLHVSGSLPCDKDGADNHVARLVTRGTNLSENCCSMLDFFQRPKKRFAAVYVQIVKWCDRWSGGATVRQRSGTDAATAIFGDGSTPPCAPAVFCRADDTERSDGRWRRWPHPDLS